MTAEAIDIAAPQTTPGQSAPTLVAAAAYMPTQMCRCGHEQDAHEHYRPGDDCGACGPGRCRHYRRAGRPTRASTRR